MQGNVSEQFKLFLSPISSWTFLATPREDLIKKSKALSVKLIETSIAFSIESAQNYIPIPTRICSLTLPTPGNFLTGNYFINSVIAASVFYRYVYPSGLFISEQILANILLQAIPQLAVILVMSLISYLTF